MLTITHSKYPQAAELRRLREHVIANDTEFPPPYIMAAMRLQYAMDEGASMAVTENAIMIKWADGPDGRGVLEKLAFEEHKNDYLVDLVTPALI